MSVINHDARILAPFHLAIPVHDLAAARHFYGNQLGCPEGRSTDQWIDFNLFGHQLVVHLSEASQSRDANIVDGHAVPIPHFGVVLEWCAFEAWSERIRSAGIVFSIAPYLRFGGLPGEQLTMFFYDLSGNALEFKAFRDASRLFAK